MRIVFFGTPDFAIPSLKGLIDSGEEIVAVVTQPDRIKGRGHKLSMPPVKEFALSKNIIVLQPAVIKNNIFYNELKDMHPDCIVVVAYGKIIPPEILQLPPLGCVNVHGSLLPKYRGAAPVQWALINGEAKTGITTMMMDEGLDTGDILLMEETTIEEGDNAQTLGKRLSEIGASLLLKTLTGLKNGAIKPSPQEGEPSYAPQLKKDDGKIQWQKSAREIFNLIRGTYPWPCAFCYMKGERINIIKARVIDDNLNSCPGRIEKIYDEEIYIGTGKGILSLIEIRPQGKKNMSGFAFINGRRLKEGMSFDLL